MTKVYEPAPAWARFFVRSPIRVPVRALTRVSLTVEPGEICVVAGPNGAGKSTLFRILTGLLRPTSGHASVLDHDAATDSLGVRRNIGFVAADDRSLWLQQDARANLEFRGRLQGMRGVALRARIDEVLDVVGLSPAADRTAFALSAGMRARLQVACALLHEPRVLILDEPTGSVDPVGAYDLLETLRTIGSVHDTAILLSTHRVEELEAFGRHVVILDTGRVVHDGDIESLRRDPSTRVVEFEFDQPDTAARASARLSVLVSDHVAQSGASCRVRTTRDTGTLLRAIDGDVSGIRSVREHRPPLRDVLAAFLRDRPSTEELP